MSTSIQTPQAGGDTARPELHVQIRNNLNTAEVIQRLAEQINGVLSPASDLKPDPVVEAAVLDVPPENAARTAFALERARVALTRVATELGVEF